jgi:hypothetical protein
VKRQFGANGERGEITGGPDRGERVRGVGRIELERDERKDMGNAKRTYHSSTSVSKTSALSVFARVLRPRAARTGASSARIVSIADARPAMRARSTLTVLRACTRREPHPWRRLFAASSPTSRVSTAADKTREVGGSAVWRCTRRGRATVAWASSTERRSD